MRWKGLLGAIPVAAGLIALLELTRVPARAALWAGALPALVRDAVTQFAVPGALLAVAAGVLFARERHDGPRARWLGRAALAAVAVVQCAAAREVLIAYHPFSWNPVANAGFVVLAVALTAVHLGLASELPTRRRRLALGLAALLVVGSLGLARAHYAVYVGQYPTLHACTLQLCFLGVALGLALGAAALDRSLERRAALRHGSWALGAALLVVALLDLPSSASARPFVVAYTELGRAAGVARALERDRAGLLPTELPAPDREARVPPDPEGPATFAAHAGLPALPAGFDLADHDVLLVLSDATRWDRTSLPTGEGPTPHLARLGARSQVFERALSPSNGTFPSVASMLAMAPVSFAELDVRPRFWRGRLRDERTTAAEAMRAAGRATFWVGHDHEGCFSENIAGLAQGFDARTLVPQERGNPAHADADARIADAAIARVRRHRRAEERYFGLVFFVSPHDDYQAHPGHAPGAPADTDEARYRQELAFMDAQLGRLVDALEADGALDDTVVVVAGDHGEAFGEHGHRHHLTSVHDEQVHVPLVVHVPGLAPARHRAPTSTAYALPWLLARGAAPARAAATQAMREDLAPTMRALDGAVLAEMIGPRRQAATLVWPDLAVTYDLLADLTRVYDPRRDPAQRRDLRESRPDLLARAAPMVRRYRRLRFAGQRFRFVEPGGQP